MVSFPGRPVRHGDPNRYYPEEAPANPVWRRWISGSIASGSPIQFGKPSSPPPATDARRAAPRTRPSIRVSPGRHARAVVGVFCTPRRTRWIWLPRTMVDGTCPVRTGGIRAVRALRCTARRSPGDSCGVAGCRGLRTVGRQADPHRGRVGVRRARRSRGRRVRLGNQLHAGQPGTWPTAGRASSRGRTCRLTASKAPRRWDRSRPTATACTTWSGNVWEWTSMVSRSMRYRSRPVARCATPAAVTLNRASTPASRRFRLRAR